MFENVATLGECLTQLLMRSFWTSIICGFLPKCLRLLYFFLLKNNFSIKTFGRAPL